VTIPRGESLEGSERPRILSPREVVLSSESNRLPTSHASSLTRTTTPYRTRRGSPKWDERHARSTVRRTSIVVIRRCGGRNRESIGSHERHRAFDDPCDIRSSHRTGRRFERDAHRRPGRDFNSCVSSRNGCRHSERCSNSDTSRHRVATRCSKSLHGDMRRSAPTRVMETHRDMHLEHRVDVETSRSIRACGTTTMRVLADRRTIRGQRQSVRSHRRSSRRRCDHSGDADDPNVARARQSVFIPTATPRREVDVIERRSRVSHATVVTAYFFWNYRDTFVMLRARTSRAKGSNLRHPVGTSAALPRAGRFEAAQNNMRHLTAPRG
jgi:hypothetical protein